MNDILQFIALESKKTPKGYSTTLIFTPAAIDIIMERYGVDGLKTCELMAQTYEQNPDFIEELSEEDLSLIEDGIVRQVCCEDFILNKMNITDYITIRYISTPDGEIKVNILSENELEYI